MKLMGGFKNRDELFICQVSQNIGLLFIHIDITLNIQYIHTEADQRRRSEGAMPHPEEGKSN